MGVIGDGRCLDKVESEGVGARSEFMVVVVVEARGEL